MGRHKFETLGLMIDLSRNAVMTLECWERFLPIVSKMGYNAIFLYTEDTYEVEGEPYFGYMRGRYSIEEMKKLEELGERYGVEMIPCIQTLGHLEQIFRWGQYQKDVNGVLLVGEDRTYELIENMFKTLSGIFKTRRIHIGMDEAMNLGRGKYLDKNGYDTQGNIMKKHLDRVNEIAKKYGYELMIWSDMFFRGWNNDDYYAPKCEIPAEYKDALPGDVIPVYWDYYMSTEERYDNMLYNHAQLSDKTWFAGGIWTWLGFSPSNKYTVKTMTPAVSVCKKRKVKNVFFTFWGDDGAECPRMSVLPALFYVAEISRGNEDMDKIKAKFRRSFGIDFDEFMMLDDLNRVALNPESPFENASTAKYMLYSDYFNGHLDYTVREGGNEFYRELSAKLKGISKKSRKYGYLFDTASKLSEILSYKYELGVKTRAAYQKGDKEELLRLADNEYAKIEKLIPQFIRAFERQWLAENKHSGFEVQEIRLGGLRCRTESCRKRLLDYVSGKLDSIPELECQILPLKGRKPGVGGYINRYETIATSNILLT